jgi:lipopolysaccharide transport system ATP-binding protein
LSIEEIVQLMPEIESFAEIGDYIDQPVRIYSSGMQVRLAFSVATAIRPDVLIIDEALSVGDTYFQHKSFDRIRQFRQLGTTLLIVSHDKAAIQSICDRAILINNGKLAMEGAPEDVMDYYNALLADHQAQVVKKEKAYNGRVQTVSGIGLAHILEVNLLDTDKSKTELVGVGEFVTLEVKVICDISIPKLILGYMIKDKLGNPIYGTNTELKSMPLINTEPDLKYIFRFNFNMNLGPGTYSISVALTSSETHLIDNYEWRDHALVFSVVNSHHEEFLGCAWLDPDVLIKVENESRKIN